MPGAALGSSRLAIVDLSEHGHMPMSTPDGRYWITYNGEVYNYRELRPMLEARGCTFRSNTDTEVVLYLYATEGPAMLDRLNGMFAFAIWDAQERTLFMARDRLGVKPLYYAVRDQILYFASEEKALFAAGIPARFDQETWEELLIFRYVAGEQTPFEGVKRVLPGHYLLWRDGRIETKRWWNLAERAIALRESLPKEPLKWFRETLDNSVNLRRIADVPVGVLLSGGLDSSSIAASLAKQSESAPASFTVRFEEAAFDEGPVARQVADQWGLEFHDLKVSRDELISLLLKASWLNDEPLVHGNDLHLLALSQYAKSRVTVLLSGEGADETLGGYVRYQPLRYQALLSVARSVLPRVSPMLRLNGRVEKLNRFLALDSIDSFVLFNACETLPDDLEALGFSPSLRSLKGSPYPYRGKILAEARNLYPKDYARQAMYSDQHTFLHSILDRNDRMTMGASIECRTPFLDYRLVEGLAALPTSVLLSGRRGKQVLRKSVGHRLPEAVLKQPKWGFGVPWASYFREVPELRDIVTTLPDVDPIRNGPFKQAKVRNVVNSFLAGDSRYQAIVRQLVMITFWYQACIGRATRTLPILLAMYPSLQFASNQIV
jgi:asparagine synthase (glutamine-hydrolysing)